MEKFKERKVYIYIYIYIYARQRHGEVYNWTTSMAYAIRTEVGTEHAHTHRNACDTLTRLNKLPKIIKNTVCGHGHGTFILATHPEGI